VTTPRESIENAYARYGWTFDVGDIEGIALVFTQDAEVEFGEGVGVKAGRPAIVEELRRRRATYEAREELPWHVITNVFVQEQGEREAVVKAFFTLVTSGPANGVAASSVGYYDDVFVDDGDAWRVRRRRVVSWRPAFAEYIPLTRPKEPPT
jgi:hypothetical protein